MDDKLQIHSLLKDELIYEVTIRSETPTTTVLGLRKQLSSLLEDCPSEAILDTDFDLISELRVIEGKLADLEQLVTKFENLKDKYAFYRSKALGIHLQHRLNRVSGDNPATVAQKSECVKKLKGLLKKIIVLGPTDSVTQTPPVPANTNIECSGERNVAKWNVKFNGVSDSLTFVEKVEELQQSSGISDQKLFNSVSLLFVDQGKLWFNGVKSTVSSWSELKSLLLEEFLPADYDYRLMSEIRSRSQGAEESTHIYFAVMSGLFSRLKKSLPEHEQLEILLHNIRPHFTQQLALVEINSISELKTKCRQLEAARQRAELFTEPTAKSNVLTNDFAYKGKKVVSAVSNNNASRQSSNAAESKPTKQHPQQRSQSTVVSDKKPVCFKCGKTDHSFRLCRVQQSGPIKCFKCNELGYTIRTCPKCNNNSSQSKNGL